MEALVCHPPGSCSLAVGVQNGVAGAPKGSWVFTGGADGRVLGRCVEQGVSKQAAVPERVDLSWEAAQGERLGSSAILALALSPCGSLLAVADEACRVQLLSVASGAVVALLCRTPVPTASLAFAATGEYIALGGGEPATIRLVHIDEASRIDILRASAEDPTYDAIVEYSIIDLAMDPLGCYFVTVHEVPSRGGSASATAKTNARSNVCLWSVDAQRVLVFGLGHVRNASCARFSPDGQVLAIGDDFGRTHLLRRDAWDAPTIDVFDVQAWLRARGRHISKTDTDTAVVHVAWDARSVHRLVLAARLDEDIGDSVILYDMKRHEAQEIFVAEAEISALACSPTSALVYYVDRLGQLGAVALPAVREVGTHDSRAKPTKLRKRDLSADAAENRAHPQDDHASVEVTDSIKGSALPANLLPGSCLEHGASSSTVVASASSSVSKSAGATLDDTAMVSSMSDPECSTTEGSDEETDPLARSRKRLHSATRTRDQRTQSYVFTAQEPFQIGSTIDLEMKRRILQWNPVGCLVSMPAGPIVATSDEPARQIELEFSDVSRRSIRFPDRYGFQYGALNTNAMFLAARSSDSEPRRPALVYYRPHESWSPNSDWVRYLPLGEEPIALGMGKLWVAIATTAQMIRLYSFTGLVTDNFHPALSGGILTLVANDDHLCILSRGTGPQSAGEFLLLRIHENGHVVECLANGPLPLPATDVRARPHGRALEASRLVWAGISDSSERVSQETTDCSTCCSDAGQLWIYHATGHLYMLRPWTFGCYRSSAWTWSPGCHPLSGVQRGSMHLTWQLALTSDGIRAALERDVDAEPIEPGETWFYPLGVRNLVLHGVVVDRGLRCPAAYPRPQVHRIPLERYLWPNVHDGQSSELEQSYLTTATALRATQSQLFDAVAFEHAITGDGRSGVIDQSVRIADLADKARQLQRKADKLLLYLIEQACETQRDRRVMDLVSRLSSATAFKVAVQIANRLKRAILADKIAKLAEARLEALGETSTLVEQLVNLGRSRRKVTDLPIGAVGEPSPEQRPCPVGSAFDTKFTAAEEAATGAVEASEPLHLHQLEAEQATAGPRSRTGPSVRAAAAASVALTATTASTEAKTSHPSLHIAERLLPLTRTQIESGAATGARSSISHPLAVLGALQK